jgi:hypothetical protein
MSTRALAGHTEHIKFLRRMRGAPGRLSDQSRRRHVVPATPNHEQVLAIHDQADRTGTRNRINPDTAGGGPSSQDPKPATHTPEQATAAARPQTAHKRQRDAATSFVHTLKQKSPLTRGSAVPEVGLEPHSNLCKHWELPKTYRIRANPSDVRPSQRPKLLTETTDKTSTQTGRRRECGVQGSTVLRVPSRSPGCRSAMLLWRRPRTVLLHVLRQ